VTTPNPTSTYTFAAVSYLNAAPLAAYLDKVEPGVEVVYGLPAQLVDHVLAGRADAAMVPVVDYFRQDGLEMIESVGISVDGDARSVLLKCSRPLEQVRTVAPDPTSKASNAMAEIVLRMHLGLDVRLERPPAGQHADAEVVIGDRALCAPPAECGDYDLGGFWKAMTSLPFVFAVWAYPAGHPHADDLKRIARAAKDAGIENLSQIAAEYAVALQLSQAECLEYISQVITYDLGPREIEGMELFREMLSERNARTVEGHER